MNDVLRGILAVEGIALGIALVMPVTPSKTGSTWTPADAFWEDPSYLQEVAVAFVVVNGLMAVIALFGWVYVRFIHKDEG